MKTKMFAYLSCLVALLLFPACNNDDHITVESVRFETSDISIKVGDSQQLTVTISPENAENKTLIWNSSVPDVATVNAEGVVSAIKTGQTIITASTEEGGGNFRFL